MSDSFLRRQCVSTCPDPAPCACAANEDCIQINRDCQNCAQNKCIAQTTTSSSGISKGALIGGILGVLALLAIVLFLFVLYRRSRLRKAPQVKKDIPASAETVLNRPDPTEKLPSVISPTTSIDLDHLAQSSLLPSTGNNSFQRSHTNPFEDTNSIQTAGTEGSNVIPIALVPNRASLPNSESPSVPSSASSFPMRPIRSPELNLNFDPTNVANGAQLVGSKSSRSGISSRYSYHSYMSNASSASDLLNEAPMIMTPMKGSIRQVVGAAKAEVINADSLSSSGGSSDGLNPPAYTPKSVKSPLASTSFGPDDVVNEADETPDATDPFDGESTSIRITTASAQAHHESSELGSILNGLNPPSSKYNVDSRPSSMATQAGSVINISSATRVAFASSPTGPIPRRTTMGRLVTPPASASSLQEQQQRALAHAHAQAQAQGLDTRRMSGSSVLSAASTRADSILESFPFVPPSPISDRPIRSPPVSPLSQQSFVNSSSSQTLVVSPPSPLSHQSFTAEPNTTTVQKDSLRLPPPPDRKTLGLSTGSQLSTASSGLSSFPFQIESESVSDANSRPSTLNGRKRASLDTLALTTALSSYPLGFDRDNAYPPKK